MRIGFRIYWLQKGGCAPAEYEDGFYPESGAELEVGEFRCAVADGATESSFSGLWAAILAEKFRGGFECLPGLQGEWRSLVAGKKLPWYAEQKLEKGAHAALVELNIKPAGVSGALGFTARAFGDCCLFHIRDGQLVNALPVRDWHAFNNSPLLISTNPEDNRTVIDSVVSAHGHCQPGDIFYLMSDAIACWFLRRLAERGDAIRKLERTKAQAKFEEMVKRQRARKDESGRAFLANDDVTLVRVKIREI